MVIEFGCMGQPHNQRKCGRDNDLDLITIRHDQIKRMNGPAAILRHPRCSDTVEYRPVTMIGADHFELRPDENWVSPQFIAVSSGMEAERVECTVTAEIGAGHSPKRFA
ncbi:hypothetical protein NLM33_08575 [Bradyrhizobium sp. CCGUVB1N3]|uniref:hypothetical protein n=1 Tax=Bradyrhizobium sp. CCGUVB1N3 TaxID=2949629 RepID=UPI0020B2B12F|nr:hypothetical protein [Bradyrhizobium sp. CCGUVB1N3]MCP3470374.1 hypothetical protein [Bradyrhizobium sp. CCGUVB1N3]